MILINPIVLLLFQVCLKTLAALCMYGGLRKRAPLIIGLGLLLMVWFVLWTIIYHKRKIQEHKKISSHISGLLLLLEVILLAGIMGYYGKQIVESAKPYSGRLSSKIQEYTNSKKVTLKHNNIYEDGIIGIFEDLKTKIDLPEELYLVNQFSVNFLEDGTITDIYCFFHGRDDKGKSRTYLISYDDTQSKKMTVWLDGDRASEDEGNDKVGPEDEKMDSLFGMMEQIDLQECINEYEKDTKYSLKYYGYSDIYTSDRLTVLDYDGNRLPSDTVRTEQGVYKGYEISIYTSNKELVARYMDGFRRLTTIEEEPEVKIDYEIGKSVSEDGEVYYFQNENLGWRLMVIDAAAGSRWYKMENTSDGGKSWTRIEPDPFPEVLFGVADSIWFFDEKHGFVLMGGASETHSELYYTEDGGFTFSRIKLLTELVEVTIPDLEEYDYITMPYLEENVFKVSLRLEKYDCCSIYFESKDLGKTWSYSGVSEEYEIFY